MRSLPFRVSRSNFAIRLAFQDYTLGFIYTPPRLSSSEFSDALNFLDGSSAILGDFNVQLNPFYGRGTAASPSDRFAVLGDWAAQQPLLALCPPLTDVASAWDHCLVKHDWWEPISSRLRRFRSKDLGLDTSHPTLDLCLPFPQQQLSTSTRSPTSLAPGYPAGPESLRRFHLGRLRDEEHRKRLLNAYAALAPTLDIAFARAETQLRTILTTGERQEILDGLDAAFHQAVLCAADCSIGHYDAQHARTNRTTTTERRRGASVQDAERCWRRSHRGNTSRLQCSADGLLAGLTASEETVKVWSDVWHSEAPALPPPAGSARANGAINVQTDSLAADFTVETVAKGISNYKTHKSGGEDGEHALLLSALAGLGRYPAPPIWSGESSGQPVTSVTSNSPTGHCRTTRSSSQKHSSTAPAVTPLPFLQHLVRLFTLCAASRLLPLRCGRALVTLIPKAGSDIFTAKTCRPIAGLCMFRRLFETIFVRRLAADTGWCRLHPGQAGFRRGYSCTGAQLWNHSSLLSGARIAIFLDIASAFPSVDPTHVFSILQKRGAPVGVQQMSWAIMTSGARAALVVNGERLPALPIRIGLQQGSACSPNLFAFVADEPLQQLNVGVEGRHLRAMFFADDAALVATSAHEAQALLDKLELWATSRSLRFNVRKCGVVSASPVNVTLYGVSLPQVPTYRYLGIPRSVQGLDLSEWLETKVEAMDRSLRYLQAIGSSWSPACRLQLFRSHCLSLLDFAGGLVPFLLPDFDPAHAVIKRLDGLLRSAACWIVRLRPRQSKVALGICGLIPASQRFQHLALALVIHLRRSARANPARRLLTGSLGALPHSARDLVSRLRHFPLVAEYDTAFAVSLQLDPPQPLTTSSFARRLSRNWLLVNCGALGVMLVRHAPSLTDRVIAVQDRDVCALAVRWRAGSIFIGRTCLCGSAWDCGHTACLCASLGWWDGAAQFHPSDHPHLLTSFEQWREACLSTDSSLNHVHLMDYVLGHSNEIWHSIALDTLQVYAQPWSAPVAE